MRHEIKTQIQYYHTIEVDLAEQLHVSLPRIDLVLALQP